MSIYATLWVLKFPLDEAVWSSSEWVAVMAQGVPPHIGSPTSRGDPEEGDPFASFLPPAVETDVNDDAEYLRAVVFVVAGTPKGTERNPQEYVETLLTLTGEAYAHLRFEVLYEELCDAIRRRAGRSEASPQS